MTAAVTQLGFIDMQVCVPAEWTDEQAEHFANSQNPAGTELQWHMRKAEDAVQAGAPLRVPCAARADHVHIMLSC